MKNEILSFKQKTIGRIFSKIVKEGDKITFSMGTGINKKKFTRPVLKITEKTIMVNFDESYPCSTSKSAPVGNKYINIKAIRTLEKTATGFEINFDTVEHFRF